MGKIEIIKLETEEFIKKLIDKFEINVQEEGDVFHIIIKAEEEAPIVIGRHGETIRAIQKILEVIFYKKFNTPVKILVNVNDYREKQKEKLEKIAKELAEKTLETKKSSFIKNLSAYERKVIHEYIGNNYPQLVSESSGDGKERVLMIKIK